MPTTSTVVTVFGGADLDLRDAILPGGRSPSGRCRCSAGCRSRSRRRCGWSTPAWRSSAAGDVSGDGPESDRPGRPGAPAAGRVRVRRHLGQAQATQGKREAVRSGGAYDGRAGTSAAVSAGAGRRRRGARAGAGPARGGGPGRPARRPAGRARQRVRADHGVAVRPGRGHAPGQRLVAGALGPRVHPHDAVARPATAAPSRGAAPPGSPVSQPSEMITHDRAAGHAAAAVDVVELLERRADLGAAQPVRRGLARALQRHGRAACAPARA